MSKIEIRDYQGDFEDVAELAWRVWVPEYHGKTWIPLPEAAFLRGKLVSESGAVCLVAYAGAKLVGTVFSMRRTMRIDGADYPVSMFGGLTVEPSYRGVALSLIERLRRANEHSGAAFGIGMVLDDPTSPSFRFWTKYAETYPKNFRFVFKGGYWAKFLRSDVLAKAGIRPWERLGARTMGPLLEFVAHGYDSNVRPYVPSDFEACVDLVEKASSGIEWAMRWSPEQLAAQFGGAGSTTLVYERGGTLEALVSCHSFPLHGRELIRCALIDLWAADAPRGSARARLMSQLCSHMRQLGVDGLVAPRSATMPVAALLPNLFIPGAQRFRIGIFPTTRTPPLEAPRSWSFEIT